MTMGEYKLQYFLFRSSLGSGNFEHFLFSFFIYSFVCLKAWLWSHAGRRPIAESRSITNGYN